jgi:hypothetical protein
MSPIGRIFVVSKRSHPSHPCDLLLANTTHRESVFYLAHKTKPGEGARNHTSPGFQLVASSQKLAARRKPAGFRPLSKPGLRALDGGRLG